MCGVAFVYPHTSTYRRPRSSPLLPLEYWPAGKSCANAHLTGCSEQVHLALGDGAGEMVVVWSTTDDTTASQVTWWSGDGAEHLANGSATAYSQLLFLADGLKNPAIGVRVNEQQLLAMQDTSAWAQDSFDPSYRSSSYHEAKTVLYGIGQYKNPQEIYDSPLIHTVTLTDLVGGNTYGYRVSGSDRHYSFTMPPHGGVAAYPLTIGLTADLGQTAVSNANIHKLRQQLNNVEPFAGFVLLAGDLSYADGYYSRWDSFGRMIEPLASEVPLMVAGGNHEFAFAEAWQSYNARYPMPFRSSGSVSNLWWSRDIGPVHVIALCSYAGTTRSSLQHRWLVRDLSRVDRKRTPWLIVMMHAPWYNSNFEHVAEAELMRLDMENLLYAYSVDLVLSGHTHAYERTYPVFDGCLNSCAPLYLNLGDGGNREGVSFPWREPQPVWSAFREASFGVGTLLLINETHALYNWSRSACEDPASPDHINFNMTCEGMTWGLMGDHMDGPSFSTVASDMTYIVRPRDRLPPSSSCHAQQAVCSAPASPPRASSFSNSPLSASTASSSVTVDLSGPQSPQVEFANSYSANYYSGTIVGLVSVSSFIAGVFLALLGFKQYESTTKRLETETLSVCSVFKLIGPSSSASSHLL